MGTQQSKEVSPPMQWEWLENDNGVEIYRNKQDGRIAERRRVTLVGTYTLSEQNKAYAFRSSNPYGLVKSYDVIQIQDPLKQKEKISDLCKCGNQKIQLDVFTQRIQYRLSQLPQLTFPESLLILKQTATAFEVAYQRVGGLHINPELIGITDKGEVRAWVNQNWALNRPSHIIPMLKSSSRKEYFDTFMPQLRDQTEMLNNLISVISQKTEKGQFPQSFADQLKVKATNFRSIRKFLNEYVSINNVTLPAVINKNKIAVNNNISNKLDSPFIRSNSFVKPDPVRALPQKPLQQSFQIPKFSFTNAPYQQSSLNKPTLPSFQYKPSSALINSYNPPSTLSFSNFTSQIPLSHNSEIKEVVSNYKPYLSETKKDGQTFKPMFNQLKFNLLQQIQSGKTPLQAKIQPISSSVIFKPESPLYTLTQLTQGDGQTTHHNASYKILSNKEHGIEA